MLGLLAALLRADAGVRRAAMRETELVSALLALVWDPRMRAAALSLVRASPTWTIKLVLSEGWAEPAGVSSNSSYGHSLQSSCDLCPCSII